MIASTSTFPRSTFFSDFGSETLRSALSGRRESLRLFNATPPAIPAIAAPPASKGVFAFEASSATLPPAFETEPSTMSFSLRPWTGWSHAGFCAQSTRCSIDPTVMKTSRSGA